jgi:hypothetical protein
MVDDFLRPADGAAAAPAVAGARPATATAARAPAVASPEGCANARMFGTWSTLQIGHTVDYAPGDGYVHQRQEIGAQAGNIVIKADHTFVWNSKVEGVIRGQWRDATASEVLGGFGTTGIRLIRGESGWDYNVQCRRKQSPTDGDSIAIWTSGYQVNGYRVR